MTAALTPAAAPQTLRVTQPRVLLSEWTKFRSLRSTVYTLLVSVVLSIGIGALFSAVSANQYHTFSPADQASFNPITTSLNGTLFSQLAIGVLGVLMISGEFGTGMILLLAHRGAQAAAGRLGEAGGLRGGSVLGRAGH